MKDERVRTLVARLKSQGASLVGFGDVSIMKLEVTDRFPVAISLAVKYDAKIVDNLHMDEESFHLHMIKVRGQMTKLHGVAQALLSKWNYNYVAIPHSIPAETLPQMRSDFPLKTGATCAGLGWIGKCSLLITNQFGPRQRLGAILTDAPFKTAKPITESRCGNCSLCAKACPAHAIKGVEWHRGIDREELFDAFGCNEKRREGIPAIGRKDECGLCIQACPVGRKCS